MVNQYHILNGDSLSQQLPDSIEGEIIVMRECLVDGNVQGNNLDELFKSRASFISQNYPEVGEIDYSNKSAKEILKITMIQENTDINLWFEEDLFCQVNFWFVINLIKQSQPPNSIFLVKPKTHNQYGFAELDHDGLHAVYHNRQLLTNTEKLTSLWPMYQNNETDKMVNLAAELDEIYPFLTPAINAHIARIPSDSNPGKPTQTLIQIMKDFKTTEFGTVFHEFCKRESIYGFGDLQVKRLFDQIMTKYNTHG